MTPFLFTLDEVDRIVAVADIETRNREITAAYHALACRLAERIAVPNLTWCAFGSWASATVGRMIRLDELPGDFREAHQRTVAGWRPVQWFDHEVVHHTIERAVLSVARQVSRSLADGNTLVFRDLAPIFVALARGEAAPPGTPDGLVTAFGWFERAIAETDPHLAAQQMLTANVLAAYEEQVRLHDAIEASLGAAVIDACAVAIDASDRLRVGGVNDPELMRRFHTADRIWHDVLTRGFMRMRLPDRVLDLGRNVPRLPDGRPFPDDLIFLMGPEPLSAVGRFDRSAGTLIGSAAHDWCRLEDRMNYITNLFRSRQHDFRLLQDPG